MSEKQQREEEGARADVSTKQEAYDNLKEKAAAYTSAAASSSSKQEIEAYHPTVVKSVAAGKTSSRQTSIMAA